MLAPITYGSPGERLPYDLEVRKGHFSWGASASSAIILLYVANLAAAGAIGTLTQLAIKKAFGSLGRLTTYTEPTLDREEAVFQAKWKVAVSYDNVEKDELTLRSDEHVVDDNTWVIDLCGADGSLYQVEIGMEDGLPHTTRIRRTAPG